jgi:hypothetical protein
VPLAISLLNSAAQLISPGGTLSLLGVVQANPSHPGSRHGFDERLHWHCHFIQKLESQPSLEHHELQSGSDIWAWPRTSAHGGGIGGPLPPGLQSGAGQPRLRFNRLTKRTALGLEPHQPASPLVILTLAARKGDQLPAIPATNCSVGRRPAPGPG